MASVNDTPLKAVGFWRSCDSPETLSLPHPVFLVNPGWRRQQRNRIADYLRHGVAGDHYWGYSYCRFPDGPPPEQMGDADLSDGIWLWPEGLHVYVSQFDVMLPDEFVEHMERNHFVVPKDIDAGRLSERAVGFAFWKDWCRRACQETAGTRLDTVTCFEPKRVHRMVSRFRAGEKVMCPICGRRLEERVSPQPSGSLRFLCCEMGCTRILVTP